MKTVLAVLLAFTAPTLASAADFPLALDKNKPVASITIPDDWKPKLGERGLEGTAPDGRSFIVVKVIKADEKIVGEYNDETTSYLAEQGVTFPDTKSDADDKTTDLETRVNDLDVFTSQLDEPTTFKGMPTSVVYYAIPFGEAQTLNIITRGPKDDATLATILASVKSAK